MSIVEMSPDSAVQLGSTVSVTDASAGHERTYTIVEPYEARPVDGRLSAASPIGGALLGHHVGDQIDVYTPKGVRRLIIAAIA
ncbi:MAG: GreA/GreB family elongation factor [Solirubrobacteraceae bacterium]|jgi:transcription elongation factor GreA